MKTIIDLLENSAGKYSNNPYLLEKKTDRYESISYRETKELAYKTAAGLLALGIEKGDRIALLSESRTDWVISELGILHAGAICVPLSILLKEGSDLKFRLDHSGSRWVIVSALQYDKINAIRKELTNLEKVILLDHRESYADDEIFMGTIRKKGEDFLNTHHEKFMERVKSVGPNDYANISYTSGTTSDPKAIILSHRNYTANIEQTLTLMDVPEWWTTLLILPWDHSFAHTVGIYIMMATGSSLAAVQSGKSYLDSIKNIPQNIREIKPVFLLSAPALAKNFRKGIEKGIRDKGPVIEKLFRHALKVAYKYNGIGWDKGKGFRFLLKPLYKLYDDAKTVQATVNGAAWERGVSSEDLTLSTSGTTTDTTANLLCPTVAAGSVGRVMAGPSGSGSGSGSGERCEAGCRAIGRWCSGRRVRPSA